MEDRARRIAEDRIQKDAESKIVRGDRGRFAKGNPGSPGRKPRATEVTYLIELTKACGVGDWREITKKIVERAKAGEMDAVKFLASYLLGPAKSDVPRLIEAVAFEVTGLDPVEAGIEGLKQRQVTLMRRAHGIY